ncbi:MAG: S8 family serine peptidase [Saprospiraceae bacterium]|nr:S8 family serine peptidase [Saprospiraceae bacterium]
MQRFIFLTSLLVFFGLGLSAQNQILVNIVNQQQFGAPNAYYWGASALDASGNYYTVGHTSASGTAASLLLVKQGADGEVAWQQTFTPSPGTNCYGIGLTTDANGNIYVIGASKGSTGGFDFVALKYASTGTKLWHQVLAGTSNGDDIPTGIVCSPAGTQVYVTGARSGSGGQYDYWTHCLNGSNGSVVWSAVYDYAGLNDAPAALRLDGFGNPVVTGVSAASDLNWELATVKYNASNGQQLSANRVSNNGIGLYLPSGLDLDGSGNMYVTGTTATSLTEFDIKTVRVNSDFTLGWQKTFDAPSTLDSATQVKVTAAGDVYVSGFYRRGQQGVEGVLLKYDASGDLKWKKVRTNSTVTAQCRPHRLTLDASGNAFVAYEITDGEKANIAVVQYTSSGEVKWERTTARVEGRDLPLGASLDAGGRIYVTSLRKNALTGNQYQTFRLEPLSRPLDPVGADSTHFAKEVLVRFAPGLTNTSFIDNKNLRYGKASQVLNNASAIAEIGQKISSSNFGDWTLIKIHPNMTTADSVRHTPEGRKIIVPDFYNTFLLLIPRDYERIREEKPFADTLESTDLQCFVRTAEPNFIVKPDNCVPDDPIYAQQGNLHPTSSFPNGHINCEEAWCIAGGGSSDIKVAIVDSGVRYTHEDFNIESSSGSVVTGGRIYTTGADLTTDPDNDLTDHGTRVASVIGSIRNNATGVAGISGGNDNADGVRLVGLNALAPGAGVSDLIQAFEDAVDEFGVNIINCSGGYNSLSTSDSDLFREKIRHANRMGVVICASRGNGGGSEPRLPGTIQDEWVICVGGTGTTGEYNPECRIGAPIDIAAPSRWQLTRSAQACIPGTGGPGIPCTQSDQAYGGISFTSGATPHAAGVAALMMSYYNATPGQTQLTHDDIEYIIQASATDVFALPAMPGYDDQTGHGLLNAGAALKMIERPRCNVFHFGSDVNPHTRVTEQVATNIDIVLTEPYTTETGQSFPKGNYKADVWKVTSTVSHPLPGGFTVDHFWPRHSACTTFDLYTTVNGQNRLIPVEKDAIVGTPTGSSAVVTGYVYLLKDNNCVDQGWIPATKEDARLTYSLIGCDPTIATAEAWPNAFRIYPNPANDILNIDFAGSPVPSGARLLVMDFSGRTLKTVNLAAQGELQTIQIGDLPQGVFICQIQMEGKVFSTKFVKM